MIPLTEAYPGCIDGDGEFLTVYDYGPLLLSMGYALLVRVDDRGYDGDSRVLYTREDGLYGVLIFGWGSCGGCDALQACDSLEELEGLRDELVRKIRWGTWEETRTYLVTHDWPGEAGNLEGMLVFAVRARTILEEIGPGPR